MPGKFWNNNRKKALSGFLMDSILFGGIGSITYGVHQIDEAVSFIVCGGLLFLVAVGAFVLSRGK
jgi:hypothetical protein